MRPGPDALVELAHSQVLVGTHRREGDGRKRPKVPVDIESSMDGQRMVRFKTCCMIAKTRQTSSYDDKVSILSLQGGQSSSFRETQPRNGFIDIGNHHVALHSLTVIWANSIPYGVQGSGITGHVCGLSSSCHPCRVRASCVRLLRTTCTTSPDDPDVGKTTSRRI